jgi:hypothetical protein
VPARILRPRLAEHASPAGPGLVLAPPSARPLLAALAREGLPLTVCALLGATLIASLPAQLVQDSWLALVAGREIVDHGLPLRDSLTVATAGARWIDQQWLGQLALYGVHELGGMRLLLAANALLIGASFGAAAFLGRRLGGSPTAVGLIAILAAAAAPWSWQLRPQSLAYPLFVAVVWLLVTNARRPSPRVYLVFPLLALWANLHGSVVLAAALVALAGLAALARPSTRLTGALLALGAPLCVFASPYATDLSGYYRSTLGRAGFADLVTEWGPAWPGLATAPFLALVALAAAALVLARRRVTPVETLLLLATAAAGVAAVRNVVWFALAALVVIPSFLGLNEARHEALSRLRLGLALGAVCAVGGAIALVASRPASWYESQWPEQAAAVAGHAAADDPTLRVLASERTADWLLWEIPELEGRVAFDARFELLSDAELTRIARLLRGEAPAWHRQGSGYRLVVVDAARRRLILAVSEEPGASVLFADPQVVVVLRASQERT